MLIANVKGESPYQMQSFISCCEIGGGRNVKGLSNLFRRFL